MIHDNTSKKMNKIMFPAIPSKTNNNIPISKNIKKIDNWCWLGIEEGTLKRKARSQCKVGFYNLFSSAFFNVFLH
jgi:hypothetical protein